LELDPATVPTTVNNFLSYVKSGFYANTLFHRVIPGFVTQGGGFTTGLVEKPGLKAPIALESNKGLSKLRGTLAMARTGLADSATSQFFINLVDNTSLDYQNPDKLGYAVFGNVVQGLSVVDSMATQPTATVNGYENVPVTDVTITSAKQIK
jgi:peptidyl-prolyl cis-trans isomerase A (cyclophilin A)